jgi:flavin-dependent dehydrogenase
MQWPEHPNFPNYGYTITRYDLDGLVAERAVKAGASLLSGTEVVAPIIDDGLAPSSSSSSSSRSTPAAGAGPSLPFLSGVTIKEKESGATRALRARYVVVADGANSRVGRMLGTNRRRDLPLGMALRGYYTSTATTIPSLSPTSTFATPRGMWSPVTAGSSPWAMAGSTSESASSPPIAAGRVSTRAI